MKVESLLRVGRNVVQLAAAQKFYADAFGFQPVGAPYEDNSLAQLLGVNRVKVLRMRLGAQEIELSECHSPGAPYPLQIAANDLRFQHIAIVTTDMKAAYRHVMARGAVPISTNGPQHLPKSSGNVTAFKFRDPEGHPLELLAFTRNTEKLDNLFLGFDHSAIVVSNIERSVLFYENLGLSLASKQRNHGPEQDALDSLPETELDVMALKAVQPTPHLELLHYREPKTQTSVSLQPNHLAADRLVFASATNGLALRHDPDGHVILLEQGSFSSNQFDEKRPACSPEQG